MIKKQILIRYWLLLILSFIFSPYADNNKERLKWENLEKGLVKNYFSKEYKDSLNYFYNIKEIKGLRTLNDKQLPFKKNEKLVYDGGWGFIRAGYVILSADITSDSIVNIDAMVTTNNFVDAFYKVRDYVRTSIDPVGIYPYFFEQHLKEVTYKNVASGNGSMKIQEKTYEKNSWILYDHKNGKLYSNRTSDKTKFEVTPFIFDYLSLLYYLRAMNIAPGDTFSLHCFVHGKDYPIFFKVLIKENVEVKAGTFSCLKIEPRLVGEGYGFTKKDKMYIWLTDDCYKTVIKVKSKVKLGWIGADLLYYERK